MAGSQIPNYCVMCDTANVARVMEKMGEGMRIHISSTSKELLDKVGGYQCDSRGILDLGVSKMNLSQALNSYLQTQRGQIETFWLVGLDNGELNTDIGLPSMG